VEAVNRGDDTDTVGAIAGAVAGARFGADELPNRWLREVDEAARLRELSDGLLELDGGDRG
jgi:ADP-ribosyl-[dinitrogen reductase] hydrolase